ncbi:non-ribosomal peptide synthetase [Acaryochloris marina]|uniref:Nonribosomal protein synthetase n=1 Tax=Acaryochloris marina (strain MBIC 11017) TaxID=329726 RepID=A8ZKN8_ACAM1|nr:non-ribosomal peptide synthetase [Acaryochloris marina]ABW31356.1 nonribosomal protein synthetase [Acaryochloris marina MBIC11017]
MKPIESFLSDLYRLDVKLWVEGTDDKRQDGSEQTRLRCNAPEDILTADLSAQISARKAEIIAFLNQAHAASHLSLPEIQAIARPEHVSLSFAQQRLWFLDQMEPNSPLYNIPAAARLTGTLDAIALDQSFNAIVQRHESLRTAFQAVDGQPVQMIVPELTVPLQRVDLSTLDKAEQEVRVLQLAQQEAQQPFDLTQAPLLRVTLIRLTDTEHVVLLTMHHIISDAWSMDILLQELTALYGAFSAGQPSPLSELSIQYADLAVWQRQWLQGEVLERHLSYWHQQLGGNLPILQLPSDRPRPRVQSFRGAKHTFTLSAELTAALKALSQQAGVTLFMTLLASFKVLLHRYTGQADLLVGSPIANRNRSEIEGLIGFFVNTLVLRSNLADNPTFRELLQQVQQTTLAAYEHQDLPFEKLVEELQPERDLSYSPLFQVKFALENAPTSDLNLADLTMSFLQFESSTAKLDLSLDMSEEVSDTGAARLGGTFEYSTDLFDKATIQAMAEHFQCLLTGIVAHPDQCISDLPLLTEAERYQQFVTWNDTQVEYAQDECFHQRFEAQVEQTPNAIALVFQDEQLTYAELNRQSNQLAYYLQNQGVKPEVVVGLCVERSPAMILGLLGILKAGGAYLPLDPTYPPERLAFMLADAQVPLLVTTSTSATHLPNPTAQVIKLDADWPTISQEPEHNPSSAVTVENLAYLIYTSGSTGTPKGVLVPHAGLVNLTDDKIRTCQVRPDSRVLQFFSLSFDASVPEIVMSLGCGAALHLAPPEDLLPGPGLLKLLREQAITHITAPPSALTALPPADLPALQMVLVGGEAPSPELIAQWSKGRLFINAYGPTETTVNASMVPCEAGAEPTLRPAANKQLYILDRHLQLLPIGVPGELYIGGIGLARGYLNRPEKTAAAFVDFGLPLFDAGLDTGQLLSPNSKIPSAAQQSHAFEAINPESTRLYKTGDLACYRRDGHIKLLGRLDHQVKIRGFRIELGEIEARLAQHPAVQESVVIVREDQPGERRLVAYVATSSDPAPTTSELHRFVAKTLPKYMVPAVFVRLEALPLNPNGKVDRQALPAPDTLRPALAETFVAPRNSTETCLVQVFADVLEVKQVGVHDDFFELGGHSLLATKLIARLLKDFQIELAIADLFESPTVAGLAERIESLRQASGSQSASQEATHQTIAAFLKAEAVLDPTIRPAPGSSRAIAPACGIFLTGATGFLGAFLLAELLQQTTAKIYCLVRSHSQASAQHKLQASLTSYQLWHDAWQSRIIPIVGDLAQPRLGLTESQFQALARDADMIYHSGAWVHHASPYSLLKASNVLGTEEVLRLACHTKVKPVHFMSATSVFAPADVANPQVIREQEDITNHAPLGGYNQSKWVAEHLVVMAGDRGLPVAIYRLGRISGHSQTGVFNPNDFLYRLIIGCVELGYVPKDAEMLLDMIPVDYASRAIAYLSQQPSSQTQPFHLVHPQPVSSSILFEALRSQGYTVQQISEQHWRSKLLHIAETSPNHPLYPLIPLLTAPSQPSSEPSLEAVLRFDCQNTLNGLAKSEIACPPLDQSLLHTYFTYLSQNGWLKQSEPQT